MNSGGAADHFNDIWRRKFDDDAVSLRYAKGENQRVDKALSVIGSGRTLLDVGCGSGVLGEQLSDRFDAVFGVDIGSQPAAAARALGVHAVVGDFGRYGLPFDAHSFDVVTALSSLQYAIDPAALVSECHRVLEPGGRLVLSLPNMRTLGKIFRLVVRGNFPTVSHDAVGYDGGTLRYFCFKDVARLLTAARFDICDRFGIYCRPHSFARIPDSGMLAPIKQEFFSGEMFLVSRKIG